MTHASTSSLGDAPVASLAMVNIDAADPARQASFYAAAFGWEVTYSDENYGMVEGGGVRIGFGKVDGFRPASWPDESAAKRFHLDLQVDDLDSATERLCALGASRPEFQPGAERWRVLLDPDGQPFCICPPPAS